jgi:hypothetical protein
LKKWTQYQIAGLALLVMGIVAIMATNLLNFPVATNADVPAGTCYTLSRVLVEGAREYGSFKVVGSYNNDIIFYISDPSGATILNYGRVSGGRDFEFRAYKGGAYTLYFDNSFDAYSAKAITLTENYETAPFLGFISLGPFGMLIAVLGVAVIAYSVIQEKRQTAK